MDNKLLVSAIVSTYNSEKFIRGKIEDLLSQTIANKLEIIIINSGSQQNEDSIIKEYLTQHENIKYIKTEKRETIYKAWNRGIKIAEGKYITNANTDDRLKNDAYEILSKYLEDNDDVALVYADQYVSSVPNQLFNDSSMNPIERMPEFDYLVQLDRCIIYSQPMWRSSIHFKDKIWFDEDLEVCGDHEFELNISRKSKMLHLPIVLGTFYKDPQQSNKSFQDIEKVYAERLKVTQKYIIKYLRTLDKSTLLTIRKKFSFYVKIPFRYLQVIYRIKKFFMPEKHQFTFEFIYYFTSLIDSELKETELAVKHCKKFLKYKSSFRISDLLSTLSKSK